MRFYTERVDKISDSNSGSIQPFAQRDVIDTLISGMSPDINFTLFGTFRKFLTGYHQHILNLIGEKDADLSRKVGQLNIDDICTDFLNEIEKVKRARHISPTVETVSILSKEDLAEMAESLIYLTYLKRRISSDEESVGGPVDVAIISKGDGFIWIKRKHYFDPKYNAHFSNNYFKNL